MTILKPLRLAVVASLLVGCAAPHQQLAQTNAAQNALYAEVVDPLDHWPTQTQFDISILESDFFTHYQQDYANGEVYDDFPSLTECALPQERALEIARLSPEMINPPSKSATIESLSTVGYEQISIRSTPAGCHALSAVEMHTIPNMVVELKQLPDAFRHPVYIHAVYTNHIKNRININGSWRKSDLGKSRITVKRYRRDSGLNDFPVIKTTWQKTDRLKKGDIDTSRFIDKPMYVAHYVASTTQAPYQGITLIRQTVVNKTGNSIRMRWQEEDRFMNRTWTHNGTVLTQRDGVQHGVFIVPSHTGEQSVYCKDMGQSVDYFRIENTYDCVSATESSFGEEGVYMDPLLKIRNGFPSPAATIAKPTAPSQPASTFPAANTPASVVSSTTSECAKAYAAKEACGRIPGDPFGIATKLCISTTKKKFGGLNCPIPL
ncbi:hypothetical protein Y017_07280 [Alcanivorax sp. 97CO-5]|uniref:hypothetical protein n=1 Tax=unclassified Alcanivorax TaxID=2638842 RepID=UPI0003E7DC42|nr:MULTISPECIES: hypothetical protein [unclassified Alcanivorax]EUC71074.1 hypothetical protein Y017_07280 [Alcanivorax sp. 97CO-5]PKG02308.1 hypothetical protein Y019_03100 [Alcanivorax sp. 97CO-6]